MTIGITKLIREYEGFDETTAPESQITERDRYISRFFTQWTKVGIIDRATFSLTRDVYISDFNPLRKKRFVIKTNTFLTRYDLYTGKSFSNRFPTTEEVAYSVCKLIGWNVIPKTKVIHQKEIGQSKYCHLLQPFLENNKIPFTFAVQEYIPGATLPLTQEPKKWHDWHAAKPLISLDSFQRCFLINLILGRRDARGDNIIHNPQTGEFSEIDNESLGSDEYPRTGALNNFPALKEEPISDGILEDVLKVKLEQIAEMQKKYVARDLAMFRIWSREPTGVNVKEFGIMTEEPKCIFAMIKDLQNSHPVQWKKIRAHLVNMQQIIKTLKLDGEIVTLNKIESALKVYH